MDRIVMHTFEPGHFTQLIRRYDWPPEFAPQLDQADEALNAKRRASAQAGRQARRGFQGSSLNMAGAAVYVKQWQQHEQRSGHGG